MTNEEKLRKMVRKGYGKAIKEASCCCSSENAKKIGYDVAELESVPEGATVSFGCGNPVAMASLKEGETVVDLGSGGGLDCFLAANKVGEKGKVIGVDMTPEMLDKPEKTWEKASIRMWNSGSGKLKTCRSPTTLRMLSSRTA